MKKVLSILFVSFLAIAFTACSNSSANEPQPQNIDKNNVGDTSKEGADQTDPTLIEGNLEDNDFKN